LDSLTHIVLGACIGEAVAGKKLGKKAMLLGALAQSLPDVDFITTFWLSDSADIVSHRGITHSILFAVISTFVLSWASRYIFRKLALPWKLWFLLFGINILVHIFIDGFNAYGIGWFEPFSDRRYSFNILFVADPFFSIWPFIACVILLKFHIDHLKRKITWQLGIALSVIYLAYAVVNKLIVSAHVRKNLVEQGIAADDFVVTPTPFNTWLWFIVAKDTTGYSVGYRSVFDSQEKITFNWFPRNDYLLASVSNKSELKDMLTFADSYYTVEKRNDTTVFNVLRFGQIVGWHNPREKFAFYYYLDKPGANEVVAQRGRFAKWDAATISSFIRRIKGN
jgi:inner membrane protein